MAETFEVKIIARIHSDFPSKFGIPRQSGLVENLQSFIVFEPEYRNRAPLPQRRRAARDRRFFPPVADLAVFQSSAGRLVSDSATAKAWRKHQNGSICYSISISS